MRVVEPVVAVPRSGSPPFGNHEIESAADVLHVLPAHQIGEAVLVVASGIELIEGALPVVGRVGIARRLVVLRIQAWGKRRRGECVAYEAVSRPGANRLVTE